MGNKSKVTMISNADVELLAQYLCSTNFTITKKDALLAIRTILNKLARKEEDYNAIYSFCEPVKEGMTSTR